MTFARARIITLTAFIMGDDMFVGVLMSLTMDDRAVVVMMMLGMMMPRIVMR
jgi:hypothetical protein